MKMIETKIQKRLKPVVDIAKLNEILALEGGVPDEFSRGVRMQGVVGHLVYPRELAVYAIRGDQSFRTANHMGVVSAIKEIPFEADLAGHNGLFRICGLDHSRLKGNYLALARSCEERLPISVGGILFYDVRESKFKLNVHGLRFERRNYRF